MSPFILRDEAYSQAIRELEERGRVAPFLLLDEGGEHRRVGLSAAEPEDLVKEARQILAAQPSRPPAYAVAWDGEVTAWEQRRRAVLVLDGGRERDAWLSCRLYHPAALGWPGRLFRGRLQVWSNPVMFDIIRNLLDGTAHGPDRLVLEFPGCRCGNPLSRWSGLRLRLAPWVVLALGLLVFGRGPNPPTTAAVLVVAGIGIVGGALWLLFSWSCWRELRWRAAARPGNRSRRSAEPAAADARSGCNR